MAIEVPPPEAIPVPTSEGSGTGRLISLVLLVISVSFSIAGQLTLKAAMDRVGRIGSAEIAAAGDTLSRAMKEPRLWLGLFLFGISAIFWLVVLSRVPLSVAYPLVGVSYILIVLLGRFALNETVPVLRWIGVLVVAAGIAIIGISFRRAAGS
jgi:multidrug transporter EmrE-like cation transporter